MEKQPIVFFDGTCNLCNRSVQLLLKLDKKGIFRFASLQSAFAAEKLGSADNWLPDSVVLLDSKGVHVRSDAVLRIAWLLGGAWRLTAVGYLIPGCLRNACYNGVAVNRYRWFGKRQICMLPDPAWSDRFLD